MAAVSEDFAGLDIEEEKVVGTLTFKPTFEILPKTKRTEELTKRKLEELRRRKEEAEKLEKDKEQELARRRFVEQQKNKQRLLREQQLREQEQKRKEEEEQRNNMQGGLDQIMAAITDNTSAPHMSLCGITLTDDSGPSSVKLRVLAQAMGKNSSCMSLDISRKGLSDEDGQSLADMLASNKFLQKLELEGNNFGVRSAEGIGEALKKNTCLRCLNLESNNLTANANDQKGIIELANALVENRSLRVLMLGKNGITAQGGKALVRAVKANESLTLVDLSGNDPSLTVEQLRAIDDAVQHNRERQSAIRRAERRERFALYNEEFKCRQHYMQVEALRLEVEAHEERRLNRMKARFERWVEEMKEMAEEEQRKQEELMIEAADRADAKPRGKKRK